MSELVILQKKKKNTTIRRFSSTFMETKIFKLNIINIQLVKKNPKLSYFLIIKTY